MTIAKRVFKRMVSFITSMAIAALGAAYIPAQAAEAPTDEQVAQYINEIGVLVNKARVEAGLKPVYILPYLNEVAEIRAEEVSIFFAHTRGSNDGFHTAIDRDIVSYGLAAENLAGGKRTPEETFEQWRNSSGHWGNIMNPNITHMGVGFCFDNDADYKYYWQQTFVATEQKFADQYLPTEEEIVTDTEGDLNGDGVVDTYDYLYLTDYIRKSNSDYPVYFNPQQMAAADCFVDGLITSADAKVMQRYILGEYKTLKFYF